MNSVRRLAAVLAADVVGYSRLMGTDEEGTLARLRNILRAVVNPKVAEHRGRIVKTTGDGILAEFQSVVDALRCAVEIQTAIASAAQPPDRRIQFRIGIHQGDIVFEDGDIFGDGVNIAARLEGIAEPGGICVSARVQEDAAGRLDLSFFDMGDQALKNITRPVRAYRVRPAGRAAPQEQRSVTQSQPAGGETGVLRPGTVLGHTYAIEALLGRGGLGEVYRARHVELGTTHAVKVLAPALGGDAKVVQLLVEEARKLAQVRHDAIVAYEGLFRDEQGRRYLVMEFVEGPSLAAILTGHRLEADDVLRLRDRLAEGLAAVHSRGIIHRDISPDNIILPNGEVGRAKLIDFGFAGAGDARDSTLVGANLAARHAFASPEQLGLFGGRMDARSDIYSLGLVLAAAAIGFGRRLEMGAAPGAAIAARQKPPDLSAVPVPLRPVIAPMLEPRPEDRPASARLLADGSGPAGTVSPDTARRPRSVPGRGWIIAAGSAAAALLIAGAVVAVLLRPGPAGVPSPEVLRSALAAATAGYDCGAVSYALAPDRTVRLAGHVATAEDLAKLRREAAAIPGIGPLTVNVRLMGRPHCEVATLLAPLAERAEREKLSLSFSPKSAEAYVGERPALEVRSPGFDSYIYIDYFDSGGQVLHLFPNDRDQFNIRPFRNHFTLFKSGLWTVCGNVGQQLITDRKSVV